MHVGEPEEADAVPQNGPYRLVSSPASATLFRHVADRHVRLARKGGVTLRAVRRALRQRYPDAELSRQRNCRVQDEVVDLWFAYRDGRAQPLAPQHAWWERHGLARVVFDASGRLIAPNAACRRLLDLPPGRKPMSLRGLLPSELFEELLHDAKLRQPDEVWFGSLTLRLPAGRRLDIEFHIQPQADQRFRVTMRSLADRDLSNDWLAVRQSAIGSIPAATLRDLFETASRRTLGSGERLANSLADDTWVVLVTAGIVRLYVALDGYEPTLAYGNSGSLFGTHALLPDEALLFGLQAVTPTVLLQLSTPRVEELAKSNPMFLRAISGDVRLQLHEIIRSYAAHTAGHLRQRLAREIVILSDLHADEELVPVTEQQLADGIGSIRESVGRIIGDLRSNGSIATTRHGLLILDKKRLRQAAQVGVD